MTRDYIWFKTRVGFASVTEPSDILVFHAPKFRAWYIYARMKTGPEMTLRNVFGIRSSISSPGVTLAFFTDGPGVQKAIGECMARIEDSIRTKAEFCDLSQFGDPQAWGKRWVLIEWPNGKPAASYEGSSVKH
jgi:hypothetical protein